MARHLELMKELHKQQRYINSNSVHEASLSINDRLALGITNIEGTMQCAYIFCILSIVGFPALAPLLGQVVPSYVSWISQTFIQLVSLSVIIVGQNLQSRHMQIMAENDYHTNVKAEQEIQEVKASILRIEEHIQGCSSFSSVN